jgi:hypothetical protein
VPVALLHRVADRDDRGGEDEHSRDLPVIGSSAPCTRRTVRAGRR